MGPAPDIGLMLRERVGVISARLLATWRAEGAQGSGSDATVEADLIRLAAEGVAAVAGFLETGDLPDMADQPARSLSWAAKGVVTLSRVTRLYVSWRDACSDVVRAEAERLGTPPAVLDHCLSIVDLAFEVGLVRMARRFEGTRRQLEQQLSDHRARLEHQALHDPLTGLANRALLMDRLERAIQGTWRRGGRPVVLFFDLDDFKAVNDAAGHSVGDDLLVGVAGRVRRSLRSSDTIARLGGDEFVVLCEDLADPLHEGVALAQRIAAALREPFRLAGRETPVAVSIGVAAATDDDRPGALLSRADQAMYQAKQLGRDRIEVYDPAMDRQATRRAELSSALHRAVADGQLDVAYQPVFALPARRLVDREALLRWHHPELGTVPPSEFVPAAEQNGVMGDLGAWILVRACEDGAAWRDREEEAPGVTVNVSARQLHDRGFAQQVADALGRSGLPAGSLTLEVAETVLMGSGRVEGRLMFERLREVGVRIGLDDFGIGSSSLSWLAGLPIDLVKIDRSFVAALGTGDRASSIVEAMVRLAHTLGLGAVAKGVETEAQLDWLADVGCDAVQGFLLGHPEHHPGP